MGQQPRRSLGEEARRLQGGDEIPEHLRALAGPFGPWVKEDRIEFSHVNNEAQEWLARLSSEDVADIKDAVSDFVRRRVIRKWIARIFWAVTTGFGAVYAAGEKLLHFIQWIGSSGLDLSSIGPVLKRLVGL